MTLIYPFDTLICNAGLSYEAPTRRTDDGFEQTFGVNHLGHFTLSVLLYNKFSSSLKNISIVSSSLHYPDKSKGVFPNPNIIDLKLLAHPNDENISDWQHEGRLRYVHSKLCNLLFAYELSRKVKNVNINAFNPGFIPNTNLNRDTNFLRNS